MAIEGALEAVGHAVANVFITLSFGYQAWVGDPFFNATFEEKTKIETVADSLLIPYQYALVGRVVSQRKDGSWFFKQRFDYSHYFWVKNIAAWTTLPISFVLGGTLKGIAYIDPKMRRRYRDLKKGQKIQSHLDDYREAGLFLESPVSEEPFVSQGVPRRPGDEKMLSEEKEALKAIGQALTEAGILWWVDCGTCLGAYRHGGAIPWDFDIDIAILEPDFANVEIALQKVSKDYKLADISSRDYPASLHKLHVRKDPYKVIDIYYFRIMPEEKTLNFILSQENNIFLPRSWKIRERVFKTPVRFEDVFPLKKAVFDGIEVFVPNHPEKYLARVYGEDLRPAKVYNPLTDAYEKDLSHPYWERAFAH